MIESMRVGILVIVAFASGWAACGPPPKQRLAGDGELVIEVGGGHGSLAASLQALGVPLVEPEPLPELEPERVVEPPLADPEVAPEPRGDPAPQWFEVRLGARETLMDLAKVHLGSGLRFKEILELNGWTDRDARRLRIGQVVRIPIAR